MSYCQVQGLRLVTCPQEQLWLTLVSKSATSNYTIKPRLHRWSTRYRSTYMSLMSFVLLVNLWNKSVSITISTHIWETPKLNQVKGNFCSELYAFSSPVNHRAGAKSLVVSRNFKTILENCPRSHRKHQYRRFLLLFLACFLHSAHKVSTFYALFLNGSTELNCQANSL